ncbi:MAG TPA: hypothetical protein VKE74_10770 [Gemmataceae bacterium]|nr:hypothetical protein [Gemmataceae bacterium]
MSREQIGVNDAEYDRWATAEELVALGADPEAVALLPVRHTGERGRPCWPLREARDLLALDAMRGDER